MNIFRSNIAIGSECNGTGFFLSTASAMNKLEALGRRNVFHGIITDKKIPSLEIVINNAVNSWFSEINNAPMSVQYNNIQLFNDSHIGHFLTLTYDKGTTVGCIATQWEGEIDKNGVPKYSRITCNYFKVPFLGAILYQTGDTCVKCGVCDNSDTTYGLCVLDPDSLANQYSFNDTI
ncbi:hypothetical protein PVAND_014422 [Polypedilum vanderplanki]|uniref:SCP domain-containing protein n=1 Tax=Polypedilum vanderplanki TaxID=319348 RepID=A0A9J6B954_POLVA|nr:hypothetical protein PVAND_014422 [Polypedilum vanderplanki]